MGPPARLGYNYPLDRLRAHTEVAHYSMVTGLKSRLGQADKGIMTCIIETQVGQVIRFVPRNSQRNVTIRITGRFDGCAVMGYRCHIGHPYGEPVVYTRGNENAYFATTTTPVEILR